jgi:hypothetical protein
MPFDGLSRKVADFCGSQWALAGKVASLFLVNEAVDKSVRDPIVTGLENDNFGALGR